VHWRDVDGEAAIFWSGGTRALYDQGMELSFPLIDLAVRRFVILPHFLINYEYMAYKAGLGPASLSKAILLPSD